MSLEIRPFRRSDREQVTALVNNHVAAVIPGITVSVNTVLGQLEREPGEFIVDPWVAQRETLVAELRRGVVAAAHLLMYGTGHDVGEHYRGVGEIRWLICAVDATFRPGAVAAGAALAAEAVERLKKSGATRIYADGALPAPGVYGIPEQWPHLVELLEGAGFRHDGRTEVVLLARVEDLPPATEAPVDGVDLRRSVGINGTRFAAIRDGERIGFVEVEPMAEGVRAPRLGGWADVGNFEVAEAWRGHGLGTWLLGHAADWLRLGGVERLLDYAEQTEVDALRYLEKVASAS